MAQFQGTGTFTLTGQYSAIRDVENFAGDIILSGDFQTARNVAGPITLSGDWGRLAHCALGACTVSGDNGMVTGCQVFDEMTVTGDQSLVTGNVFFGSDTMTLLTLNNAERSAAIGNVFLYDETASGGAAISNSDSNHSLIVGNVIDLPYVGILLESGFGGLSVVSGNTIRGAASHGIHSASGAVGFSITGNFIDGPVGLGIYLTAGSDDNQISDNQVNGPGSHGIEVVGDRNVVADNLVNQPGFNGDDTYDGIRPNGDRNLVEGNKITPIDFATYSINTRSAVNVLGGDCNIVVGNDLGDPADYGTDALIDAGTNTQLFYPADATYGDNFTACTSP